MNIKRIRPKRLQIREAYDSGATYGPGWDSWIGRAASGVGNAVLGAGKAVYNAPKTVYNRSQNAINYAADKTGSLIGGVGNALSGSAVNPQAKARYDASQTLKNNPNPQQPQAQQPLQATKPPVPQPLPQPQQVNATQAKPSFEKINMTMAQHMAQNPGIGSIGNTATKKEGLMRQARQNMQTQMNKPPQSNVNQPTGQTVKSGDTLSQIAVNSLKQRGMPVNQQAIQQQVQMLAKKNNISNPNMIRPGQQINY